MNNVSPMGRVNKYV